MGRNISNDENGEKLIFARNLPHFSENWFLGNKSKNWELPGMLCTKFKTPRAIAQDIEKPRCRKVLSALN